WQMRNAACRAPRNRGACYRGSSHPDDEAHARRAAAADVQRLHVRSTFDLVVAGFAGDLPDGVEQLAHARGAHRVARADQAAARVDRVLAVDLEPALVDRLPALAGSRDDEGIAPHV